jgi:hypothetical protein
LIFVRVSINSRDFRMKLRFTYFIVSAPSNSLYYSNLMNF